MKKILLIYLLTSVNIFYSQNGNALHFDGTNDFVSAPLPTILGNAINNSFTVETWVNPSQLVFSRILFAQLNSANFVSLTLGTTGQINVYINNTSANTTTNISINQWTHLAFTWNHTTSQILIYLNGVPSSTVFGGTSTTGTDNIMTLGARTNQAQFFNGILDELRIWNTIRTQSEIQANKDLELTLPQTNLVTYYKFNQGVANQNNAGITTLNDALNSYNGTLNNFALTGNTSNWVGGTILNISENKYEYNLISIFPNPSNSIFNLNLQEKATLEIYDLVGKQIKVQYATIGNNQIDLSNYKVGMYLIKLINEKNVTQTIKLLKK